MNIQGLKRRERESKKCRAPGMWLFNKGTHQCHWTLIHYLVWNKIHKEAILVSFVLSQTLKNDMTSLVHIVVPCGRYKLISFSEFYLFPTFTYFFLFEGRVLLILIPSSSPQIINHLLEGKGKIIVILFSYLCISYI